MKPSPSDDIFPWISAENLLRYHELRPSAPGAAMALLSSRSDGRDSAKGALSQMLREINGLKNRTQGGNVTSKLLSPPTKVDGHVKEFFWEA